MKNMDFSSVCRTCLDSKSLHPIFKAEDDYSRSTALFIATGLKVHRNDGLPQKMCYNCIRLLHESLQFREQCKDTETQLLSIKNHTNDINSELKSSKVHTESETYLKKKKSKDRTKAQRIDVKIERDISENDDEIPLKSLLRNISDTKCENVKTETRYVEIEIEEVRQDTDKDFFENLLKTDDLNIEQPIKHPNIEDLKYDEEFLDPNVESDTETNVTKIDIEDIESINVNSKGNLLNDVTNMENVPFIIHDTKRVTCKLCQKNLSRRSIDSHMTKRHPGADTRKVKCDLCDAHVLKQRLNRHMIIMHGKDCFRCGYCKTEYGSKDMLVSHVATCTSKRKKRTSNDTSKVECDICHKMMQKASLRMHKEIKHAGMGPVCEHCGRRFGNKFRLNEHLRAKHGYEKFKCSLCDFLSASSMAMRNHERRHRGEKPFVCEACGAKFHAPHLLTQHKQSHRTEKIMKCNLCPAAFKTNNTLHMHKMTCHNSHTYQCTMCPRTYSCRHYAVKHLRNVHRFTGPVGALRRTDAYRDGPPPDTAAEPEVAGKPEIVAIVERDETKLKINIYKQ